MSEAWRIEPEPAEEELAALMAAIMATLRAAEPALKPKPVSAWARAARHEAIDSQIDRCDRWSDHP